MKIPIIEIPLINLICGIVVSFIGGFFLPFVLQQLEFKVFINDELIKEVKNV